MWIQARSAPGQSDGGVERHPRQNYQVPQQQEADGGSTAKEEGEERIGERVSDAQMNG